MPLLPQDDLETSLDNTVNVRRGKHVPTYAPSMDMGSYVVVINAEKVTIGGKKYTDKMYYRVTGRPGAMKTESFEHLQKVRPAEAACCSTGAAELRVEQEGRHFHCYDVRLAVPLLEQPAPTAAWSEQAAPSQLARQVDGCCQDRLLSCSKSVVSLSKKSADLCAMQLT